MYKKLLLLFISFSFLTTSAQIGINTTDIENGVMLQIDSEDSGVLIPRISLSSRTDNATISGTLTNGTLIYNINNSAPLQEGFYYWQNNTWVVINTGAEKNIYNTNGSLNENRTLNLNGKTLDIQSGTNDGFRFNSNGRLRLEAYGNGLFSGALTQILAVNSNGDLVELDTNTAYSLANQDWFEENTTTAPNSIDDNIFTNGEVGIGINQPIAPLHIFETTGTNASALDGSLVLEHGNDGGVSSIVFKSHTNAGSDYAYINFDDNGSGNGTTDENALLTIGIENDVPGQFQDDINIDASGSLGINTNAPDGSAAIDMGRNDQGLLVNRVALTDASVAAPITNPADGLLVFNTNENLTPRGYLEDVRKGFYYWDDTQGRWIPQQSENRSARYVNTNTNFNLNQATITELPIFGSEEWNDDTSLYVKIGGTNNDLQVNEDGRYRIVVSLSLQSAVQRPNIDAEIEITRGGVDQSPGAVASTGYMRNQAGHDHSSIQIDEIVEIEVGDDISINVSQEAAAGDVFMRSVGSCNFTITKIK